MAGQSIKQNKATHRQIAEVFSGEGRNESIDELVAPDYKNHTPLPPRSLEAGKGSRCLPTRSDPPFQISRIGSVWRLGKETVGGEPVSERVAPANRTYVMGSCNPELERLVQQAHLFERESSALLEMARLGRRSISVAGLSAYFDLLAEAVGAQGEVVGVDSSPDMVAMARGFATASGMKQVNVMVADAAATGLPAEQYDLVHGRLLLLHVIQPEAVVAEMVRMCRRGAVVALHDADADPWYCEPPHPAWDRLADAFLK